MYYSLRAISEGKVGRKRGRSLVGVIFQLVDERSSRVRGRLCILRRLGMVVWV
jgi:hypothetical protein